MFELRILIAATSLFCLQDALAQAWKGGTGNGHAYIEIASRERGGALRIECGDASALWLRYYPGRGWDGGAKAAVRAGNFTANVEIDGGDGALLSNLPNGDIGVTGDLIAAMKSSGELAVEGPAAARVPQGQRTFALPDAANTIGGLERRCVRK